MGGQVFSKEVREVENFLYQYKTMAEQVLSRASQIIYSDKDIENLRERLLLKLLLE